MVAGIAPWIWSQCLCPLTRDSKLPFWCLHFFQEIICPKWFLTIFCWIVLSGFLLFTDLCKIVMGKYCGILGYSLMSLVCMCSLFFCIAFCLFSPPHCISSTLTTCTLWDMMWVAWGRPDWDTSHLLLSVITCTFPSKGLPRNKRSFFIPQGNGCTGALAGRCPGSLCQSWYVPKLSKLPFASP